VSCIISCTRFPLAFILALSLISAALVHALFCVVIFCPLDFSSFCNHPLNLPPAISLVFSAALFDFSCIRRHAPVRYLVHFLALSFVWQLQEDCVKYKTLIADFERHLERQTEEMESASSSFEADIAHWQDKHANIEFELHAAQDNHRDIVEKLEAAAATTARELDELEHAVAESVARASELESERNNLKAQLTDVTEKYDRLQRESVKVEPHPPSRHPPAQSNVCVSIIFPPPPPLAHTHSLSTSLTLTTSTNRSVRSPRPPPDHMQSPQAMQAQLDAAQMQDMKAELARVKTHEGELETTLASVREITSAELTSLKDRLHAATTENDELRSELNK
jgi:regulator of replication initiation timing